MKIEAWLYAIPLRLRSLFRRQKVEQELDDELRDHLERRTEEGVANGLTNGGAAPRAPRDRRNRAEQGGLLR